MLGAVSAVISGFPQPCSVIYICGMITIWSELYKYFNTLGYYKFHNWDFFHEKGPNACFSGFQILLYSRSLECSLRIASYALLLRSCTCKMQNF